MLKSNKIPAKTNPAKKNIIVSGVKICSDKFVDEEGSIVKRLVDALPDGEDTVFDIKISIVLPDDE